MSNPRALALVSMSLILAFGAFLRSKAQESTQDDSDPCSPVGEWSGSFTRTNTRRPDANGVMEDQKLFFIRRNGRYFTCGQMACKDVKDHYGKDPVELNQEGPNKYVMRDQLDDETISLELTLERGVMLAKLTFDETASRDSHWAGNIDTRSGTFHRNRPDTADVEGKLRSSDIIKALDDASRTLGLPKGGGHDEMSRNCNRFFRAVGHGLQQSGVSLGAEWRNPNLTANDVIMKIRDSAQWKEVDESNAQDYANHGVVVEAVSFDWEHGHLATVSPTPPDLDPCQFPGHGPFVRDGNEHVSQQEGRLYPSSWGAVKASKAFGYENSPPTWYAWVPSMK